MGEEYGQPAKPQPTGVRVSRVAINQAVEIELGSEVRSAPVIAGRPARVRVELETDPDFVPRELTARFELSGGAALEAVGDAAHGFVFDLGAASINPSTELSLSLNSSEGVVASWPSSGTMALAAQSPAPLSIVIVPIVANGWAPDTSAGRLELLQRRVQAMYPVSDVRFELHAPLTYAGSVAADGTGLEQLLDQLIALRTAESAAFDSYYFGLFAPARSALEFCSGGCVGGLSFKPGIFDDPFRVSVGVGYFADGSDLEAPDVMAHELGHAHGLSHAPCETEDAEPFPYPGASIGAWGFDFTRGLELDPAVHRDVMSYCGPTWISDFNYARISARMQAIAAEPYVVPASDPERAAGWFQSATLGVDGALRWGSTLYLGRPIWGGEARELRLLDAHGRPLRSVTGFFHAFDHLPGGVILVRVNSLTQLPEARAIAPVGAGAILPL